MLESRNIIRIFISVHSAKVLSSLGLNLNNKAEAYNDPAIKSIFLLNNFNYILRSLRRSVPFLESI